MKRVYLSPRDKNPHSNYGDSLDVMHKTSKLFVAYLHPISHVGPGYAWFGLHSWLSYRPIGKWIHSTGLTGELGRIFTSISTAMQSINQVSTNSRIWAYQLINSIPRFQDIQSIKLEVHRLIAWLNGSLPATVPRRFYQYDSITVYQSDLLSTNQSTQGPLTWLIGYFGLFGLNLIGRLESSGWLKLDWLIASPY